MLIATVMLLSYATMSLGTNVVMGDVSGDGKVTLSDVSMILKYIAKWEVTIDPAIADVTGNGTINLTDVSRILKYVAKWDISLTPQDKPGTTPPADDIYEFVEADFDKEEFKFLHYGETATDFHDRYIWSEDYSGGVIDHAVAERNRLVEDKYNVKITAEECGPAGEATIRMQAGQCDFEVIYEWGIRLKNIGVFGMLYDFNELNYISLDKSYWVPTATEGLTVADRLFITTNMVTMNSIAWVQTYFFNKNMMDEIGYDYPYEYVQSGNWTYDVLLEMMMAAEKDVNRDGVMDKNDRYGGIDGDTVLKGVCAAPLVEDNGNGTYEFIPYTEEMVGQYSRYKSKTGNVQNMFILDYTDGEDISGFPSQYVAARYLSFGKDHTLFIDGSLDMTKEFAYMKSDYGIVPPPVAKAGDEYSCGMDHFAPMFGIPIQVDDPDMTAIVFEYLAYESERFLLPSYIETTLKTKRMEDQRDYAMLDIIRNSVDYNWIELYLWDSELSTIRHKILTAYNGGRLESYYQKCREELAEFTQKITSLE